MHITLVSGVDPTAPAASGTRNYVMGLAERLQRIGVPVTLITGGVPQPPIPGVSCHPVPSRGSSVRFLLRLGASAPGLPIPRDSIIHVQRPDDLMAFALAKRRNPKLCTLHGIPARAVRRRKGAHYGLLYGVLERGGLRRANRVIAVNEGTARWYGERYAWLRDRITAIPIGIDTDHFRPMDRDHARRRLGVSAEYAIVFAGRLTIEKRVEAIVQALPRDENVELLIAGSGPEETRIREDALHRPVRLLGAIPHSEMPVLLNAADLLVLPSEYEGLPTVALEALACGTPIVSTPVGALPEIIVPGRTGWIVEELDALGHTIAEALPRAASLRARCVESAKLYSWDTVFGRILDLYGQMLSA